jgi:conjugative transfer signal peptidase TraF
MSVVTIQQDEIYQDDYFPLFFSSNANLIGVCMRHLLRNDLFRNVTSPLFMSLVMMVLVITATRLPWRINTTSSMPIGLYFLVHRAPQRNDNIAVCLPAPLASFAYQRHYLHHGLCANGFEPVIKRLVGIPYDIVSVTSYGVMINGQFLQHSIPRQHDRHHLLLPSIPCGIYHLQTNQGWLYGIASPQSWDSRYYGPIDLRDIIGVYQPIMTWHTSFTFTPMMGVKHAH